MNVNKSSYLYWLKNADINDNNMVTFYQEIITIYSESKGIYGSPKITALLNAKGIFCSSSKVARAMVTLGIKSVVTKRFPKKKSGLSDNEKKLIINLIKDLDVTHINQVWTTDITYIHTINDGTFFLVSYLDYYSKKVIAWDLFDNQKTDGILSVLKQAIRIRNPEPGLICHSDKGSQFRSKQYRTFLENNNLVFSYTSIDHSCDENAAQESFHSLLKREWLYLKKLYTFEDAYREIYNYIEGFYNPTRIHSSIGYLSPNEFEKMLKK